MDRFDETREPPVNGTIESATISVQDGHWMTFWVKVSSPSTSQNIGGYLLARTNKSGVTTRGFDAILSLLTTVRVDEWGKLSGKHVRVRWAKDCRLPPVIGNLIEDEWWHCPTEME
jgi:hypothetical protein